MSATVVHKLHDNNNRLDTGDGFSDFQVDTIAKVIAELRAEWLADIQAAITAAVAELRDENDQAETVAELRGQVSVLLNLIGGNSNNPKLLDASGEIVRKLTVQTPRRRMRQAKTVNQNGSPARP